MSTDRLSRFKAVIAIDFGTSRSGFAYEYLNEETIQNPDPKEFRAWEDAPAGYHYPKTLTNILYSPDRKPVAWGYTARTQSVDLPQNEKLNYKLFNAFKTQLRESPHRTPISPIIVDHHKEIVKDKDGRDFLVLDVVADYLRFLKESALKKVQGGVSSIIANDEILWSLTVPAIWNNADKQLMRLAAKKAGLISNEDDKESLVIILEPEAAAVHCLKTDGAIAGTGITHGSRFMVIDAGGGTVDITVCEVVRHSGLAFREIATADGALCGSTYVDQTFRSSLDAKFGVSNLFKDFHQKRPHDAHEFMNNWEGIKCTFSSENTGRRNISLGGLERYLTNNHPESLDRLASLQDGENSRLYIHSSEMEHIFKPTLDKVVSAVNVQFNKLDAEGCNFIFLVGGFANSPLLQKRIKKEFESKVTKIIIPPNPDVAVLRGATLLAIHPNVMRARCSRFTYGCEMSAFFREGDPEELKEWDEERKRYYCNNRFKTFVEYGEVVEVEEKRTHTFSASTSTSTEGNFNIYKANSKNIRYTDPKYNEDPNTGLEKVANLKIPMPDITGGINRKIEVTFYFGRSEIEVEARDVTTNKKVKIKIDFSYD